MSAADDPGDDAPSPVATTGSTAEPTSADPAGATRAWLERAVIGLNLCPFAKAPHAKGQVRIAVSAATDADALLADLQAELERLAEADPARLETTLLVHPRVLADFADFNDFLDPADALLEAMDLVGVIQIASFHPDFRFDGAPADDLGHATNRSPYPTLHLLREDSVERAVATFPDPAAIYDANLATLDALGPDGWEALRAGFLADPVRPRDPD